MKSMGEHVIFVFGAGRSGTTWLAKIFDSHPDVLYRHEPDMVLLENRIPGLCAIDEVPRYRDQAQIYLERLMTVRNLKTAGSFPMFPKRYSQPFGYQLRRMMAYGLRVSEFAMGGARWLRDVPIPDLIQQGQRPHIVIKSVSSRGRARLFADALPASRIIFILRHPCGQVSSMMRGVAIGKFDTTELGLESGRSEARTLVEKLAWDWATANQKVLDDFSGRAGFATVRYEELCEAPTAMAQNLFAFAGLSWDPQTAAFLEASTTYAGPDRYYQVFKNSRKSANSWRTHLSETEQRRILDIVSHVPAGRLFAE